MEYSLLGPTGVKVSKICLGTATFGVAPDAQEAGRVVGAAQPDRFLTELLSRVRPLASAPKPSSMGDA